ncbi:MAG: hypothetical protein V2A76_15385, partial [Planctomycetota bacterium]
AELCDFDGVSLRRAPDRERLLRGLSQVNDLAPGTSVRRRLRVLRSLAAEVPDLRGPGTAREIARRTLVRSRKVLGTAAPEAVNHPGAS